MKKNLLKSALALLMAGLLVVPALSVAAEEDLSDTLEEAEEISEALEEDGEYFRLSMMTDGEEEYSGELLTMLGMEAFLLLKEDGTGILSFDGEEEDITWNDEFLNTDDGNEIPYTREGDVIRVEQDDVTIEFTLGKASDTDAVLTPAPFDPNTRAGYYKVSTMEDDGEVINGAALEMLGMQMFLVLNEDNTGTLAMFGMGMDLTWNDDVITIEEEDTEYTYDEGTITLEAEGAKMNFVYAGTPDEAPEIEDLDLDELSDALEAE